MRSTSRNGCKHFSTISAEQCTWALGKVSVRKQTLKFGIFFPFNSKFISSLYGIIPFSIHYLVILFISLFSDFKWKSYASGVLYLKMPYSVLDYSLPENSWWCDQKATLSIEKGTVGINQIFLLVLFLVVIVGIGTLLLYLKNRRFIKIYNIKKEDNNIEKEN